VSEELSGFGDWVEVHHGPIHRVRRAVRASDGRQVVVKQMAGDFPAPRHVASLLNEHELSLAADDEGVVEVLDLVWHAGLPALVFADAGPRSLAEALSNGGLALDLFLKLAIQVTGALARLHDRGIVHRDVNPSNIVLDSTTTRATIVDLGLSTRLSRVRAANAELVQLTGTLGFLSPEQTGRTGMPVDRRSDLYSLGATLFAMVAGSQPFPGNDPRELVHAHLALEPSRLDQLRKDVPPLLADLVGRLLSKAPEDRYQSAWGVLHDLEAMAAATEALPEFELGLRDHPSDLVIPQRLLGRGPETQALHDAFRAATEGRPSLMVVSGSPGIGKTAVIERLRGPVLAAGGSFLSAKFDQVVRQEPFRGFAEAFGELVAGLLARPEGELVVWREELRERLGANAGALHGLIPGIGRLLGPAAALPEVGPAESRNRLNTAFQAFAWSFPSADAPLVLFLDDVQWIDAGSLELLAGMAQDLGNRHVLLVVAVRPEELGADHPVPPVLEHVESRGTTVRTLDVGPLDPGGSRELVEEVLANRGPDVSALADDLHGRSGGNPFHLLSFLQFLRERDVLQYEPALARWRWDADRVGDVGLTDDVVSLTLRQLGELPESAQRMLSAAAVSGARFEVLELAELVDEPLSDVGRALAPAAQRGLLDALDAAATMPLGRLDELTETGGLSIWFRFGHDRIQEAALALLAKGSQEILHLRLARLREGRGDSPFATVDHYLLAGETLQDPVERRHAAELAKIAGDAAVASAAFASARRYREAGLRWLDDGWTTARALCFDLHRGAAETAWLTGDLEHASQLLAVALEHAGDRFEMAQLHRLMVNLHVVGAEFSEAVAAGQAGLALFGLALPEEDLDAAVQAELAAVAELREQHSIESLGDREPMSDPAAKTAFGLLCVMGPPLYFCDPRQCAISFVRMVRLSLEHGPAGGLGYALAFYAMMLAGSPDRVDEAHGIGELGVDLARRTADGAYLCRALHTYANHVQHRKSPLRDCDELLREAFRVGLAAGELQYAGYATIGRAICGFPSGRDLSEVLAPIERGLAFVRQTRNLPIVQMHQAYRQAIRVLQGETLFPGAMEDGEFVEDEFLAHNAGDPTTTTLYRILAAQCAYLFGDVERADRMLAPVQENNAFIAGLIAEAQHELWDGMTAARLAADAGGARRRELEERLEQRIEELERRAAAAPANFGHQVLLLKAERLSLRGEFSPAIRAFEDAADAARGEAFPQDASLAYERAAELLEGLGHKIGAEGYRRRASRGWISWGARGKARHVAELSGATDSLALQILGDSSGRILTSSEQSIGPATSTFQAEPALSSLDLAAVLEASEAIASELELEGLLERLLRLSVELAGAQRSVLLMESHEGLRVVAELATPGGFKRSDEPLARTSMVPQAVINYVRRTRAAVVEGDAADRGLFSRDSWVRQRKSKSVLCVPALKQRRLVALLYLENQLVPNAFAPRQVELLRLLASQAAVALENASLFDRVRSESRERLRAERQLQQAQKMESVGRLSSGVAHDFNNLLGVILGYASLLGDELPPASPMRDQLEQIGRAAERGAALTRRLLAFSRSAVAQPQALDLPELVGGLTRMVDRLLPDNTSLFVDHDGRPVPARADPALLEQVVVNLAVNARDAMPTGGRIRMAFDTRALAENESDLPAGLYACLVVTDDGVGIAPEVRDRIFEPFFTTKAVGDGTGLGLSTCLGIIQQSGGAITVDSTVGEGTTFTVLLPAADPAELDASTASATMDPMGPMAEARILLVEDEPTMRRLLSDALARQGYSVESAGNGVEAWQMLQDGLEVELILTDFTMPEMDGLELITLARTMHADLPVALLSGLSEALSPEDLAGVQPLLLLQKPIRPDDLALALQSLLEESN